MGLFCSTNFNGQQEFGAGIRLRAAPDTKDSAMDTPAAEPSSYSTFDTLCGVVQTLAVLMLAYVWGRGSLRGRDACRELAYFPRFFERAPPFSPEKRSDNISLRLTGIIGNSP